jgi:hypothetical protein
MQIAKSRGAMKISFLSLVLMVGVLPVKIRAEAVNRFTLETKVYVFRNRDFQTVEIPGTNAAGTAQIEVFSSPATARFDAQALSLDGPRLVWSGGSNPPDRLTLIATPEVSLIAGEPVSLLSAVPTQYVEKTADGVLHLREISKDSPEAPHWRLTFTLGRSVDAADDLRLACTVNVATLSAREKLPGVRLDVGKPILARFGEKIDLAVLPEVWSGFTVRAPNWGDYTLMTLLKVKTVPEPTKMTNSDELMTAEAFAGFATFYYQHSEPDLIARAIESPGAAKFLNAADRYSYQYQQRVAVFAGFFAEVFATNPDCVAEWRKVVGPCNRLIVLRPRGGEF